MGNKNCPIIRDANSAEPFSCEVLGKIKEFINRGNSVAGAKKDYPGDAKKVNRTTENISILYLLHVVSFILMYGWPPYPSLTAACTEGQLYSLYHTILYTGLEHPRILISIEAPETNTPLDTVGQYFPFLNGLKDQSHCSLFDNQEVDTPFKKSE